LDYYFYERLGLEKPEEFKKCENDKIGLTTNEADLNSSRVLKVNTVPENNDVLTLAENKIHNDTSKPQPDVVLQSVSGTDDRRKSISSDIPGTKTVVSEYKRVTYQDYSKVKREVLLQYDLRDFRKFVKDDLIRNHSILKLLLKNSYLDPVRLNLLKLYYRFNLIFAFNAFTLTDLLIEQRANNIDRVNCTIITLEWFSIPSVPRME
jgi:hypothetical protein